MKILASLSILGLEPDADKDDLIQALSESIDTEIPGEEEISCTVNDPDRDIVMGRDDPDAITSAAAGWNAVIRAAFLTAIKELLPDGIDGVALTMYDDQTGPVADAALALDNRWCKDGSHGVCSRFLSGTQTVYPVWGTMVSPDLFSDIAIHPEDYAIVEMDVE